MILMQESHKEILGLLKDPSKLIEILKVVDESTVPYDNNFYRNCILLRAIRLTKLLQIAITIIVEQKTVILICIYIIMI